MGEIGREAAGRLLQVTNGNDLNSEVVWYPKGQTKEM